MDAQDRGLQLTIRYLDRDSNKWDVTRAIAAVLHSDEFSRTELGERKVNFEVMLNPSKAGGVGNDGTGKMIIPNSSIANRFLRWVKDRPLKMGKAKLRFYPEGVPLNWKQQTLARTPYVDPNVEEQHERITRNLSDAIRLDAIQFGTYYRPAYPSSEKDPLAPRAFSIEYEKDLVSNIGWLRFAYDHKLLYIEVGDPSRENYGFRISIPFHSIKVVGAGYDGKPCEHHICFFMNQP
ncbi:hypothetical protein ONZ45_g18370 [Pleurotus djamor]|nr:hypothetical protein ONZ45_g18370 [Pleurotus djamor]